MLNLKGVKKLFSLQGAKGKKAIFLVSYVFCSSGTEWSENMLSNFALKNETEGME